MLSIQIRRAKDESARDSIYLRERERRRQLIARQNER
jgi:hypothetical protein